MRLLALCWALAAATAYGEKNALRNGVYAVLSEGPTAEAARVAGKPHRVLPHEGKYVALDTVSFVPLVLDGAPEAKRGDNGWTILSVTLAREYVPALEAFTRANLDGRVAIVAGGEVITLHTVRAVIRDGRAVITRCQDDACRILHTKLAPAQ
jgi:hypothetical protein